MQSTANPSESPVRFTGARSVAVVFLQGIGGSARLWDPQAQSFPAAGLEPVALDLPGYGTRPPVDAMDFDMLAADVESAIAARGLHRPVLVGHSLGGMIAQTMLRRRPAGYRAAVLSCTSPAFGDPSGDFQRKFVADRVGPLEAGRTMADLAPELAAQVMGPHGDAAGRALFESTMAAISERTYRAAVRCLVTFDERANLGRIQVPVLCLAGEQDRNAPAAMMERMAAKIPGARYVCLPAVGHMPNLEAPRAFDAAVLGFLQDALPREAA
jgi:3-oxoadipate enol-lactonase